MSYNFRGQLIYCLNFNFFLRTTIYSFKYLRINAYSAVIAKMPQKFKVVNSYWISFFCHSIVFQCHISILFLNIIPPPNLSPLHYSLDVWNYTCSKFSVAIWTQGRSIWQLMPTVLMCMTQTKTNYLWYVDETFSVMHFISLVMNDNPSRYWPYFILSIVQ